MSSEQQQSSSSVSSSDSFSLIKDDKNNSKNIVKQTATKQPQHQTIELKNNSILKKKKQHIELEEDEYIQAISDIVERDFFPHLKKMKLQTEFLEAVDNVELEKARIIGTELAKLSQSSSSMDNHNSRKNDGATTPLSSIPATIDQDAKTNFDGIYNADQSTSKDFSFKEPPPRFTTNMSLDAFMSKYTSEDNASFSKILEKHNIERRRKYNWAFEKEQGRNVIEYSNGSAMMIEGSKSYPVDPKGLVDTWKHKTENHLLYYPEGIQPIVNPNPGKVINYASTRLVDTDLSLPNDRGKITNVEEMQQERMRTQQVWKDIASSTPALFSKYKDDESLVNASHVNGYAMVAATPNLIPEKDVDPSDLMTWGMIEGTPLLLDSSRDHDEGGPSFKLAPTPRREELAVRLSERASRSIRKRQKEANQASSSYLNSVKAARTPSGWEAITPGRTTPGGGNNVAGSMIKTPSSITSTPRPHLSAYAASPRTGKPLSVAAQNLLKKTSSMYGGGQSFGSRFGDSSSFSTTTSGKNNNNSGNHSSDRIKK